MKSHTCIRCGCDVFKAASACRDCREVDGRYVARSAAAARRDHARTVEYVKRAEAGSNGRPSRRRGRAAPAA